MNTARTTAMNVVIVHYHAAESAREAVAALKADARESDLSIDIMVADNGSTPDERSLLSSLGVTYLDTGANGGYAAALNFAFPRTTADFLVVMNEDVIVLPGCLRALYAALAAGAAVAGPEFYWDRDCTLLLPCTEERTRRNERVKVAARRSLVRLEEARRAWRHHARRHWKSNEPFISTSLSGALMAFRRDAWQVVGPFDEGFRLYYEENDWLLRVANAGLMALYVPQAKAIHLHNPRASQSEERLRWEAESFVRFGERHYGESFMRRLLVTSARKSVVPAWPELTGDTLVRPDDENAMWPLWLEVSPSPFGFPAATTRITDRARTEWPLPRMRGLEAMDAVLYMQLVDDDGRELARYRVAPHAMS
jgi:N-acetylglucosaminyl-diphospho-decaprenol L-rhamnosyltransferase